VVSCRRPALGRWKQVLADPLDQNLAHLGRPPTRAELSAARRAAHSLAASDRARVLHVPGADADANAGDRTYLVLAKPNVIKNDIRLRGLAVAGGDGVGRKEPHNHAQTARNLERSLRNAAARARLIQADGLRRGEICGLHWADADLAGRTIVVRHNRVTVEGHVQEQTTKTRSGRRTVPLSDAAVAALLTRQLRQGR
jgi:integrase